jgi:hypothetical protein
MDGWMDGWIRHLKMILKKLWLRTNVDENNVSVYIYISINVTKP